MKIKDGRKRKVIVSLDRLKVALVLTSGLVSKTADILKVSKSHIYRMLNDHPELQGFIDDIKESCLDECEDQLMTMIKDGDLGAIKLYLYAHGKRRGYTRDIPVNNFDNRQMLIDASTKIDLSKVPYTMLLEFVDSLKLNEKNKSNNKLEVMKNENKEQEIEEMKEKRKI